MPIKAKSSQETHFLVNNLVNTRLLKHTIQFFSKKSEGGLKPFGSGVLIYIHKAHFILTASHVAEHLEENELYVRVGKSQFINVLGDIKYSEIGESKGIDLAYIKLDEQMIEPLTKPYIFLTMDKISEHNPVLGVANYCVVGFPEINVREENGLLETGASYYLIDASNERPYNHYKLNPKFFLLLNMKGKGMDMKTCLTAKINSHFYGISGCGLWYIIYDQDPISKKYSIDYQLIGIMTEFKKGRYFCLVANKIPLLINGIETIEGFDSL